jgi:hypothetical protein
MAGIAAALGSIGKAVLNAMGIFWLVEEVVQRIQVAQMIQQKQQMIQMRKQEKKPPSYLKSWDWTISAGSQPGRYKYTLSFTGNVPTEPTGFYRHVFLSSAFYFLAGVTPTDIHLARASVQVKSPKFSYKFSFDADTIMSGATITFEDVKSTEICLHWDFTYEGSVTPIPLPPRTTDGAALGMGGGCGGEWNPDWVHIDWQAGKLEYHRIHADPMSFGEEPFQVADALQLQSQIDNLFNARDQLRSELKDLENLAERVARYYERVEYPDWFIQQVYDNIYQRYQELAKAWSENTDAIRKLLDQLSAIAPEDAGKISKSLRDPKPMPQWPQLKTLIARPDPTGYLDRVKGQAEAYANKADGAEKHALSAAWKALYSVWNNCGAEYKEYVSAKTPSEQELALKKLAAKIPADFWDYIGDMYNYLGQKRDYESRAKQLNDFLAWYRHENAALTEQDVEAVAAIVQQVMGG